MGSSYSTSRIIALASFAINFAAQVYGMLSSPNMKEIADANHYAFSPHPCFIGAFFGTQMLFQLASLRKLLPNQTDPEPAQLNYVPIYALGNLCIAGWMLFWNQEAFVASQALVGINTAAHLYAVSQLPSLTSVNMLTHLVAKPTAGIGVLDFFDNGGVALKYGAPPSPVVQILTSALFVVVIDWIMGASITYDLVAMSAGQSGIWSHRLGWLAAASGLLVVIKNSLFG